MNSFGRGIALSYRNFELAENAPRLYGGLFVKTRFRFLSHVVLSRLVISHLGTLALMIGMVSWGGLMHAQQTAPDAQQSQQPTQAPPDQTSPDQTAPPSQSQPDAKQAPPDAEAQSADQSGAQIFSGTIMKQGNKYVFQDASGATYDIDHQTEVSKFEGKKVRIHGTLDPTTKMIHVQ
jgi:hypothetical protein